MEPGSVIDRVIDLALVSRTSLESVTYGQRLLTVLCDARWSLCPTRVSNYEPIRNQVDPADVMSALKWWDYPFLWKSPQTDGACSQGVAEHGTAGSVRVTVRRKFKKAAALPACLAELSRQLDGDYGVLFVATPEELYLAAHAGCASHVDREAKRWYFSLVARAIEHRLPDVYWVTVFGQRYVRRVGLEKMLTAPAYAVEQLDDELVLIQLTEDMRDVAVNREQFLAARDRVKRHLGEELFFQGGVRGQGQAGPHSEAVTM